MQVTIGNQTFIDTSATLYGAVFNTSNYTWINAVRGPSGNLIFFTDIVTDNSDNFYFSAFSSKYIKAGSEVITLDYNYSNSTYYTHSLIARINSDGSKQWINQSRFSQIIDLDMTSTDKLIFAANLPLNGNVQQTNLIPQGFNSFGSYDYGVGGYDLTGNLEFLLTNGTPNNDIIFGITADNCNKIRAISAKNRSVTPSTIPYPNSLNPGGKIYFDKFSTDGFCNHTSSCIGIAIDTLSDDASIEKLWLSSDLLSLGQKQVAIKLRSLGVSPLTSVQFKVALNGSVMFTSNYIGTLNQYESLDSLSLGQLNFTSPGMYEIKVWVEYTNGNTEMNTLNDTAVTVVEICEPLMGNYTIGTGGDFISFIEAVRRIKACGLGGHVYFNVLPGVYEEKLNLMNLPSSVNDSIVFRSANGDSSSVILQADLGWPHPYQVLMIGNVNYLTIEKITIKNLNPLTTPLPEVIRFFGNLENFNLFNCAIIDTVHLNNPYFELFNASTNISKYINLSNNLFLNGAYAFIYTSNNGENIVINGNKFLNQLKSGIKIGYTTSTAVKKPLIINNYIETDCNTPSYYGIDLYTSNGYICNNNVIKIKGGNGYGIRANGANLFNPALISNNMISITQSSSYTTGIYLEQGGFHVKVFNNSVLIEGNSKLSRAFTINAQPSNLTFKNNIFTMRDSGYVFTSSTPLNFIANNNCYFTNKDTIAVMGNNYFQSLPAWQTFTGQDSASIIYNPSFLSSLDLHLTSDFMIGGAAIPLAEVPYDIDGELRDPLTPDIGADEVACQAQWATMNVINNNGCSNDTIIAIASLLVPANVEWYFNSVFYSSSDTITISGMSSGMHSLTLHVNYQNCTQIIAYNISIAPAPIVSITSTGTSFYTGDSLLLTATAGLYNYQWFQSSIAVPGATNQYYYAKQAGVYHVIASDIAGCIGKSSSVKVFGQKVKPQSNLATLKISTEADIEFLIYPNPSSEDFILSFNGEKIYPELEIFDATGRNVNFDLISLDDNQYIITGLAVGFYMVIIKVDNHEQYQKLVKLN